ncbi:uncharacterized protein LOC116401711 [Cucumis sativus]|uniref:uncharacterized protein LOC116401711 n=1 Tax=Cucumis sativus TaxID=3659 RepID=UPI0012F4ECCD|nr:uncharacterized protein LOC116401711 [Cucumis sativus]
MLFIVLQCKNLIADVGDMMSVQVIVEGSMNSSNPYFSSSWRRDFAGGFILDMGVHFIAGLRMLVGCEVVSVSATTSYVDKSLPPPDNISSLFQLENGCSGVFVMVFLLDLHRKQFSFFQVNLVRTKENLPIFVLLAKMKM